MKTTRPLYWFIHHEYIVEPASEPIENRIAYIRSDKEQEQHAVRLAALQPVKHPELLPGDWLKASAAWDQAYATWDQAYAARKPAYADWKQAHADWNKAHAARQKAYADWQKAYAAHLPALVARYLIEYPKNAKLFDHATGHLIFS